MYVLYTKKAKLKSCDVSRNVHFTNESNVFIRNESPKTGSKYASQEQGMVLIEQIASVNTTYYIVQGETHIFTSSI